MEPNYAKPQKIEVYRELLKVRGGEGYHIICQNPRGKANFYTGFPKNTTDFYLSLLFYHAQDSPSVRVKFLLQEDVNHCYVLVTISDGTSLTAKSAASSTTATHDSSLTVDMRNGDYSLMQFHMHEYTCDFYFDTTRYDAYDYKYRHLDFVEIYGTYSCLLQEYHVTQDKVGLPSNYFTEDSSSTKYPGTPGYIQVGAVTTVTGKVNNVGKTVGVTLKSGSFQAKKSFGYPSSSELLNITVRIMGASAVLDASFNDEPIVIESTETMNGGSMYFLNLDILNLVHDCGVFTG
ncbi:uncharacterized protein LOC135374292 isoform X2 [Ornithodoros turicata]|uniref:uncharacterized protein LOC135374292 isoform X2 n=1 Tax=Ornithodoros turicata TaxID=34597 RepID=UPI00313895C3